jgi:transcriptional regulator with XRE-family HTH domain
MTLAAWIAAKKVPDNVFARQIGVSRVTLFRFKTGRRIPDRQTMERIVIATNGAVTPNEFFDVPSKSEEDAA